MLHPFTDSGYSSLTAIGPDGKQLWAVIPGYGIRDLAVDTNNDLILALTGRQLAKVSGKDGSLVWTTSLTDVKDNDIKYLFLDAEGKIYVCTEKYHSIEVGYFFIIDSEGIQLDCELVEISGSPLYFKNPVLCPDGRLCQMWYTSYSRHYLAKFS